MCVSMEISLFIFFKLDSLGKENNVQKYNNLVSILTAWGWTPPLLFVPSIYFFTRYAVRKGSVRITQTSCYIVRRSNMIFKRCIFHQETQHKAFYFWPVHATNCIFSSSCKWRRQNVFFCLTVRSTQGQNKAVRCTQAQNEGRRRFTLLYVGALTCLWLLLLKQNENHGLSDIINTSLLEFNCLYNNCWLPRFQIIRFELMYTWKSKYSIYIFRKF